MNLVSPMMFGAICSEFPLISWSAFACGAAFIGTLTVGSIRSAYAAKYALATYFSLTMFTLWVEPWMTSTGVTVMLPEILLKVSSTIVDVGVSFFALILWQKAAVRVDVELSNSLWLEVSQTTSQCSKCRCSIRVHVADLPEVFHANSRKMLLIAD